MYTIKKWSNSDYNLFLENYAYFSKNYGSSSKIDEIRAKFGF
jgi:hypothetical protein